MLNKKSFAHFRVTVKFGDQGKSQHKDMKFCNWGPTIIWHNIESVAFFLSKSLHPNIHYTVYLNITKSGDLLWCDPYTVGAESISLFSEN